MALRRPYNGRTRKLLLAFDVGTTYSGIGYAVLDPGQIPKIQCVTRFPGQENGDFKIPSILWYKPDGTVRAAGAEARDPAVEMAAEEENLVFVEWFKLHLRPQSLTSATEDGFALQPLPPGKSVIDVFADFLAYLFSCAKTYILDTHPNGESLWRSIEGNIDFVLSHPNGWEGAQQGKMRQAAVQAGLVPDITTGRRRISFVTEGEASIQYCVSLGMAAEIIQTGTTIMLVDAGGGTVDLSTYVFTSSSPITLQEIAPIGCILQGSTRINVRAERFLRSKLSGSNFGFYDDIKHMVNCFETYTKPTFKESRDKAYIRFGSMRDQDLERGIRNGQLMLEGTEVAGLFEPSIRGILEAIDEQCNHATRPVSNLFLVGGFAASPWLFQQLKTALHSKRLSISRPDNHTNKAVAEGAVSFALEHFVTSRIATLTYGVFADATYKANDPEHRAREPMSYIDLEGTKRLTDHYQMLVSKGTQFFERAERKYSLQLCRTTPDQLTTIRVRIMAYRGDDPSPRWTDLEPDKYTTLCTVTGNTSGVSRQPLYGPEGIYYKQEYNVILSMGLSEMQAHITWIDRGLEMRGPAEIIYYD